jgi:DNA-binding response OmpR family regulator
LLNNKVPSESPIAVWSQRGIRIDPAQRTILPTGNGKPIPITPIEFRLLRVLTEKEHHLWERAELAVKIGVRSPAGDSRALDVAVSRLRRKLQDAGYRSSIESVRGMGYLFHGHG